MKNPYPFIHHSSATLLACGLIVSLTVHFAAAQEEAGKPPVTGNGLPEMPMTSPVENALAHEVAQKPAVASKLLSDMESLDNWEPWVNRGSESRTFGTISLSKDKSHKGQASVLLTSPTKGKKPNFVHLRGRPAGSASAIYKVDNEDWTEWNRISLWVYSDLPGFRTVSFNMVLHNDNTPIDPTVDDKQYDDAFVHYDSSNGYHYYNLYSGLNYQLLENHKWNKVYWEIPHVRRDKVIALELRYRTQGNQRDMTDTVKYYFDELYLEKVEQPEHYEGWNVAPSHIAHNHVGYATGFPKTALSSDLSASRFSLIDAKTQEVVLEKTIAVKETYQGAFQVMDFSEFDKPGTYVLKAGDVQTRPFRIANFNDLYKDNLIKVLNFFYTQRCGTDIPGRHSACHSDVMITHDDKSIITNGGWHDAGDLSQNTRHTAAGVYNFCLLSEKLQDTDPELSERMLEEAKWGLDWLLKTRFGDGYRVYWATMDFWTDGIIGTADDRSPVVPRETMGANFDLASLNFHGARAQAKAAILLMEKDPIFANYALRCAKEDWDFATENIGKMSLGIAGIAVNASLSLYEATKDDKYKNAAISYGDYILRCQQQDNLSDEVSIKGFFYPDSERQNLPFPRSIGGDEKFTVTGLVGLLQAFPDHDNVKQWESAIRLYGQYCKDIAAFTDPYFMLPAGIYDLRDAKDQIEEAKIKNGARLSDRYYLRNFPVWTTGRGNSSALLSKAIGLAAVANYLDDRELMDLSQRQFGWFLGLNPFNQTIMWGEGYRHQALYCPLIGNVVGAVPCGIHTRMNGDAPYWPSDNWHNPKEIWVVSTGDYLWLLDHFFSKHEGQIGSMENGNQTATEDTGLVGWWKLDEKSGTVASDSSGRGNHGKLMGGPTWVDGRIAGALHFANTDDTKIYVDIPNSPTLENVQEGDWSVAAWVWPDGLPPGTKRTPAYGIIIKQGQHIGLVYDQDGLFKMQHHSTAGYSLAKSTPKPPKAWYHVAGVVSKSDGFVKVYVNGQLESTVTFAPGAKAREFGTRTWKLGVAGPDYTNFREALTGKVDDARIYRRAPSDAEIAALAAQ